MKLLLASAFLSLILNGFLGGTAMSSESESLSIRYVVFHSPGPSWIQGVDFREQPGVMDHIQHYAKFKQLGKLEMGGPFLAPNGGGMMIPVQGVTRDEIEKFAEKDPAITAGLLTYRIQAWYPAMKR